MHTYILLQLRVARYSSIVYFDDSRSMYMAPVFSIQVDTTVKVLESRFFTQYKSKGFGGISNWIQEVI